MFHMKPLTTSQVRTTTLAIAAAFAVHGAAHGQRSASEVSEASLVPVAISVALPVVLVAGVGSIVVTGVQASAEGTVWLVENVADGVKGSIRLAGGIASAAGMAIGTVIVVTVVATGTVLSAAGHVIAFIPNEIGRTLSYNQRVSR
jgi:hypothetical protein